MRYLTVRPRLALIRSGTAVAALAASGLLTAALPQETLPVLNHYGVTGALDTPTADTHFDGAITGTIAKMGGLTRTTLSFQVLPRVQGSFRYAKFADLDLGRFTDYYDRSFDLSVQVLKERRYLPALKIGLQDFLGTGIMSGEYVVASKHVVPSVKLSAGLGWGRLASTNDIGSPFGDRENIEVGEGGDFNAGTWFRGPAAPFASVMWQASPKLTLMAEYSSDAYITETGRRPSGNTSRILDRSSDVSFGANYRYSDSIGLGLSYMYGAEIGLNLNFTVNPKRYPNGGTLEKAPPPVKVRPPRAADPEEWSTQWSRQADGAQILRANVAKALAEENLALVAMDVMPDRAVVSFVNPRYQHEPQAMGRVARVLSRLMPASVEVFELQPVVSGVPVTRMVMRRSDLERYEHQPEGGNAIAAAATFAPVRPLDGDDLLEDAYPAFTWGLGLYRRLSYFDPDSPLRGQLGLQLSGKYEVLPGLAIQGGVRQRLIGNLSERDNRPDRFLPAVRTEGPAYNREANGVVLDSLTASYHFTPGRDLYGRATLGYFERMYGGLSAEILWSPANSRFALGAEATYARKRDFDQGFGFQDYSTVTGFVSGYADLGGGFTAQVDVGRYLAEDVGATLTLGREFANGWRIAAFATKTDVSAEEFGPGSFDKGIIVDVPIGWFTGTMSRSDFRTTLRTFQRNGGARVDVDDRLYETVRDYRRSSLAPQWERFLQ